MHVAGIKLKIDLCLLKVDGVVHNEWEENVTNETVLTFPELFADSTLMEGLPGGVPHPAYLRVPITHQRSPKKEDFDLLDSMFRNTEVCHLAPLCSALL